MLTFSQVIFCQALTTHLQNLNFKQFTETVDITSVFKKGERNKTENYRLVSILPGCQKYLRNTYLAKYQIS